MHRFSKRHLLIFLICLVVGIVLIGLGMAHVIQLKQRSAVTGQTLLPGPSGFESWPLAATEARASCLRSRKEA
jgi:hypothetical protein